ncbi:hypothetical protein D0Z03_002951 [Geotrichum reessii]|nr:hypothetical protein D0Z03_002951 [Galactomyces reessii]
MIRLLSFVLVACMMAFSYANQAQYDNSTIALNSSLSSTSIDSSSYGKAASDIVAAAVNQYKSDKASFKAHEENKKASKTENKFVPPGFVNSYDNSAKKANVHHQHKKETYYSGFSNHRNDQAIREALTYDYYKSSEKHRGKPYVYDADNLESWKETRFPEAKIAIDLVWNVTHEYHAPDGRYISGFFINGQFPGPAIVAKENDWIRIVVNNYLPVPMTIHFHGIDQAYTPWSDGMPGVTQYPILSGGTYAYIFQFKNQHGAFWYHAHYRAYSQDGIMGPIHVIPADDVDRPYAQIDGATQEDVKALLELEKNPTNLMVFDMYDRVSDDIVLRLMHKEVPPMCAQSTLINGKGRITCNKAEDITSAAKTRGDTFLGFPITYDEQGCGGGREIDNSKEVSRAMGVAGFQQCSPTFTDREIIYTENNDWVYFNIYNMAAESEKIFSIDEHDLIVVGVDGMFSEPKVVKQLLVPIATRFTVIVKPKPGVASGTPFGMRFANKEVFQVLEGLGYLVYGKRTEIDSKPIQALPDAPSKRTQDIGGSLIIAQDKNLSIEFENLTPLGKSYRPKTGAADHTVHLVLNATGGVHFSLFEERTIFMLSGELDAPYLLQTDPAKLDFSKIPAAINPGIKLGDTVDMIIDNTILFDHPFHMHGHSFNVISKSKNESFQYSNIGEALRRGDESIDFENAPFVDTVVVPRNGHAVIRFTAHNPGYWFLHCHINHHLLAGMGGFLVVDSAKIPPIPFALYNQPHVEYDSSVEINISEPYVVSN